MDLAGELNRLAGTVGLEVAGAANAWAGTTGLELIGALNRKAGTTGLEFDEVCNLLAGTTGKSGLAALTVTPIGAFASDRTLQDGGHRITQVGQGRLLQGTIVGLLTQAGDRRLDQTGLSVRLAQGAG